MFCYAATFQAEGHSTALTMAHNASVLGLLSLCTLDTAITDTQYGPAQVPMTLTSSNSTHFSRVYSGTVSWTRTLPSSCRRLRRTTKRRASTGTSAPSPAWAQSGMITLSLGRPVLTHGTAPDRPAARAAGARQGAGTKGREAGPSGSQSAPSARLSSVAAALDESSLNSLQQEIGQLHLTQPDAAQANGAAEATEH